MMEQREYPVEQFFRNTSAPPMIRTAIKVLVNVLVPQSRAT
jgi:hypothetical protein